MQVANSKRFVGFEQMIVADVVPGLAGHTEYPLHIEQTPPYSGSAACTALKLGSTGQMIGMDMGIEYPLDPQAAAFDEADHPFERLRRCAARYEVVVENRIDDRTR